MLGWEGLTCAGKHAQGARIIVGGGECQVSWKLGGCAESWEQVQAGQHVTMGEEPCPSSWDWEGVTEKGEEDMDLEE